MRHRLALLAAALLALSAPAIAGNKLLAPGTPVTVARETLTATPTIEWNKVSARAGKFSETWTLDGPGLNNLTFYGGVPAGEPLLREVDRKDRPLPRVAATMLATDIPGLLESSYRIARGTQLMEITAMQPAVLGGKPGVRFTYTFTAADEVRRAGEGIGAIVAGKLYLATFEAPVLHFFERDASAARATIAGMRLN